jgi:SAM-dependent methyltransferase
MVEPDPNWWQHGFGSEYLELYDDYLAERTPVEVDQLEARLQIRAPLRILDLPCGHGRHSIELARRGYTVTGADLSEEMLAIARERAAAAKVQVRFLTADMRHPLDQRFDLVLNLFTSFGYFADQGDDQRVVAAAEHMLEPGGRFLLELINGDRVMANFDERGWFTVGQTAVMEQRSLDRSTRRMVVERRVAGKNHERVDLHAIRLYGSEDVRRLLQNAGLESVQLFGDWDGSRARPDAPRVLAVGQKKRVQSSSLSPFQERL